MDELSHLQIQFPDNIVIYIEPVVKPCLFERKRIKAGKITLSKDFYNSLVRGTQHFMFFSEHFSNCLGHLKRFFKLMHGHAY